MTLTKEIIEQHNQPYKGAYLDNSFDQEKQGYPKVLSTLRTWRLNNLRKERIVMLKGSFDPVFGNNAKKMLKLIEQVIKEREEILLEKYEEMRECNLCYNCEKRTV